MPDPLDPSPPTITNPSNSDPLDVGLIGSTPTNNGIWFEALMPDLCTIWRKMQTRDGLGTFSDNWFPASEKVACRLLKAYIPTAKEVVQAGSERSVLVWTALFPLGTDLNPSDVVVITQRKVIDWTAGLFEDGITQLLQVTDTDVGLSNPTTITAKLIRINRPSGLTF